MLLRAEVVITTPRVAEHEKSWEVFAKSAHLEPRLIRTIDSEGVAEDRLAIVAELFCREQTAFEKFVFLRNQANERDFSRLQSKLRFLFPCHLHRHIIYSESQMSFMIKPHEAVSMEDVCKQLQVIAQRDLPATRRTFPGMEKWSFLGQAIEGDNTFDKQVKLNLAYTYLGKAGVNIFGGGRPPEIATYKVIKDSTFEGEE